MQPLISGCPNLEKINLTKCTSLSYNVVKSLAEKCSRLNAIDLSLMVCIIFISIRLIDVQNVQINLRKRNVSEMAHPHDVLIDCKNVCECVHSLTWVKNHLFLTIVILVLCRVIGHAGTPATSSGVAGGGGGGAQGAECHPWKQTICQKLGKRGKKSGQEKSGRNSKNRKVLSLCPSWQIGLATLLATSAVAWLQKSVNELASPALQTS